jgi:AraC-like DNA-binding protein
VHAEHVSESTSATDVGLPADAGDGPWLRHHPVLRTGDHDELIREISRAFQTREATPLTTAKRTGDFELRAASTADFSLGLIRTNVAIRTPVLEGSYFLNLGISGRVLTERRSERLVNTPQLGAMFNPQDQQVLRPEEAGAETLGIRISRNAMLRELDALLARPVARPVEFDFRLELTGGRASDLRALMMTAVRQWDIHGDLLDRDEVRNAQMRTMLVGLLLTQGHNYRGLLDAPATTPPPTTLRLAQDYVEEHLSDPLTLTDLARAAMCSARALNGVFNTHLGIPPMSYVRQRRLTRVRAELLAGTESIGTIAHRWGLTHLGRFAIDYRRQFGELPSETLRRTS